MKKRRARSLLIRALTAKIRGRIRCPVCQGSRRISTGRCPSCNGKGSIKGR